jgi:hypothetical protein
MDSSMINAFVFQGPVTLSLEDCPQVCSFQMETSFKARDISTTVEPMLITIVAARYATVSASFVIEQEGLPLLTYQTNGDGSTTESWNKDTPKRRLDKLLVDTR